MYKADKRIAAAMLAAVMAFSAAGCSGGSGSGDLKQTESAGSESANAQQSDARETEGGTDQNSADAKSFDELTAGDTAYGFKLSSVTDNSIIKSEIYTFEHEKSGAKLVCLKNEDPELAFGIFYKTPVVDETDTNHVFEHAIIASSEKYPSTDLFFDIANKSYSTFVNAFTYDTFTGYPLSSMSQDQLMLTMDAYLSCMTAPGILDNEDIFKREAIRYELYDKDEPIQMTGTVYAEDFGFLTDIDSEAFNNIIDTLYPGETASNSIGRAHLNYKALTYEHAAETFDRCYSFDNSLIMLYGDMDYYEAMSFIDSEYLSKYEKRGTDLSQYLNEETEPGFVKAVIESPAYEGDVTENASRIDYAISLNELGYEDITAWDIISTALNNENGPFLKKLREKGIYNQCAVGVNAFTMKPYMVFCMYQADETQAEAFREAADETLKELVSDGIDDELLRITLKQIEIANYEVRDVKNAGINIFPNIVNYWTHTGETDFYGLYEDVFSRISADGEQDIIKRLAESALNAERSALVVTVPKAGLAEEIIAERDQYLADMKSAMSGEEIEALIEETERFNSWNSEQISNNDFVIDPSEVSDIKMYDNYTKTEEDGITFYEAAAEIENIGRYALYLDAGALDNEDLKYLELYKLLFGEIGTDEHSADEILMLNTEYLPDLGFTPLYSNGEAGEARPILKISWTSLTEDHEKGLDLLMEELKYSDFNDTDRILELIERYKYGYDLSRSSDMLTLSVNISKSSISDDAAYKMLCGSQEFYYFLNDVQEKLENDEFYGAELSESLREVMDKLLNRHRLIYAYTSAEGDLNGIRASAASILGGLSDRAEDLNEIVLPVTGKSTGVAVESSDQYTTFVFDISGLKTSEGRYLPFLTALSDRYIVPVIRFENGAYSALAQFNTISGAALIYSYSDPNVSETIDVFKNIGSELRECDFNEADLDGYILGSLAVTGLETGVLKEPMQAMEFEIMGYDTDKAIELLNDMKNAELKDKDAAAERFTELAETGSICTVGNENAIRADGDCFETIVSYRENQ